MDCDVFLHRNHRPTIFCSFLFLVRTYPLHCFPQTLLDTFDFILDEWDNFLERIGRGESTGDAELQENSSDALELRFWVSYRGQTLARTGVFLKLSGIGYEKLTCYVSLLKTYMAAY